jgi:hypothetical protein
MLKSATTCVVIVLLPCLAIAAPLFAFQTPQTPPIRTRMVELDPASGNVIANFSAYVGIHLSSAAYDPTTETLFSYSESVPGSEGLYRVDTTTGALELVGDLQAGNSMRALAAHPTSGHLYGVSYNGRFYSIDKTTGVATVVAVNPALDAAHGLAFAPTGQLYAATTTGPDSHLLLVDPVTGAAQEVASIPRDYVVSLDFDDAGQLFATDNGTDTLGIVDVHTGAWTTVGGYGANTDTQAIAFTPEPASMACLAVALLVARPGRRA